MLATAAPASQSRRRPAPRSRAISEGLRQEAGPHLRVTIVSPGITSTDFAESMTDPDVRAQLEQARDAIAMAPDAVEEPSSSRRRSTSARSLCVQRHRLDQRLPVEFVAVVLALLPRLADGELLDLAGSGERVAVDGVPLRRCLLR